MIQQKVKFKPLDVIIILIIAAIAVFIFYRIRIKLRYDWNWTLILRYIVRRNAEGQVKTNYLLHGLFSTLKLSIWATVLSVIFGTIAGVFRTSKNLFLRMVGRTYVELVRNLPPLVLVFIFYFFVSDQIIPLLGVEEFVRSRTPETQRILSFFFDEVSLFSQFVAGIFTVAIFEGAYITEIVRSGIESIERGQKEAAYALGLSWFDQMRFIIMPQALRRILPPMANQFISTIKDSSIVAAISIQELTFQGMQLATSTHYTFEVWILITAMYLGLTLSLSLLVNKLERKMQSQGSY